MTSPTDIRAALIDHLSDDIVCETLTEDGERLSCLTPLQYPNGDNVEAWIERPLAGQFLVTASRPSCGPTATCSRAASTV